MTKKLDLGAFSALAEAAADDTPVAGWTHNFYRYPARFSPRFAAAAIEHFSRPSDLIMDPYMGGGTVVVEAVAAGRSVIGNDLNSLAFFIATVKTTRLTPGDADAIESWASRVVPLLTYVQPSIELEPFVDHRKTKNLSLVRARFIKKTVAGALASIERLPTEQAKNFAKCVVLRVAQWALDGRERHTHLSDFRTRLSLVAHEMVRSTQAFGRHVQAAHGRVSILNMDAAHIDRAALFTSGAKKVSLVVTSPPYPGVHVLYHRWQVDGRRETPAPYWIAGCNDGQGAAYYNFADRRRSAIDTYFKTSLQTLKAIRRVMRNGGYVVQLVAFNRPVDHLPRYLDNMRLAGFEEMEVPLGRIWRQVPNRKWHATFVGKTDSSNEVVLVHRAI